MYISDLLVIPKFKKHYYSVLDVVAKLHRIVKVHIVSKCYHQKGTMCKYNLQSVTSVKIGTKLKHFN